MSSEPRAGEIRAQHPSGPSLASHGRDAANVGPSRLALTVLDSLSLSRDERVGDDQRRDKMKEEGA
jgi:hypothetical protein